METRHVSVRGLVEFTLHGEDIRPGGSLKDMREGMLGHQARQKSLPAGWESEVPLRLEVEAEDDLTLLIAGRMDAFQDGEAPAVEEIKLWQDREPPEEPDPAHWAQAVCYAWILCRNGQAEQVSVRLAYVRTSGTIVRIFREEMSREACEAFMMPLLENYLRRLRTVRRHIRERDASLAALSFPYPDWRPGQRDLSAQVYTAVRLRRRLFASMPTGTGKSMAVLFPALKALGQGLTGQVEYLTARTIQRKGPQDALALLRRQPLHLWTLTLDAKEKQCPERGICHPDYCPRAKGHFLRDGEIIDRLLLLDNWTPECIRQAADDGMLCPFELSLSLAELADLNICDYNYALDPAVHIQRIFDRTTDVTLLIDEAHHLPERVRDMLGGEVDGGRIRRLRTVVGKTAGRKHPLYRAMTGMLNALADIPPEEDTAREGRLTGIPQRLDVAAEALLDALAEARYENFPWEESGERLVDTVSGLAAFVRVCRREESGYAWLWQGTPRDCRVTALALDISGYLREITGPMSGVVCFSATLEPLGEMKQLLGGEEEDACFSLPSPFPPENLLLVQESIRTRYGEREATAGQIADRIRVVYRSHPGKYLVFFPSFAYMEMVADKLEQDELPLAVQSRRMDDAARADFLALYTPGGSDRVSLCVMGGIFSEGIDLPGAALDGVVIVGMGLPQVNLHRETLREAWQQRNGRGFLYAYMIPGMQKVAQAVGRVIRSETDRGTALLLDDRYLQPAYQRLFPPHWQLRTGDPEKLLRDFWNSPRP